MRNISIKVIVKAKIADLEFHEIAVAKQNEIRMIG